MDSEPNTESPFLPDGRQWAWNSSTLRPAKECKRKYYYEVILGYKSTGENQNIIFGSHYAKALERFHGLRSNHIEYDQALHEVVHELLQETFSWKSDHPAKNRDNLVRSVIWYLENFREDPCKTIILEDGTAAVELRFRFQIEPDIWLCGHIDRLVEYAGNTYVQDQKTTGSTVSSYYFNRYNPDNQMSLYTLAAQVSWKTPIAGVMIDAAQIAVGFTRFERGITTRTEDQLNEWLADAKYHIKETWRAAEQGWPMNDSACQIYGGCPFLGICSKDSRVRDDFLKVGFVRNFRNPLGV